MAACAVLICLAGGRTAGAEQVIRDVRFVRQPVFTQEDLHAIPWLPLSLVNALHVDTRLAVIRRSLLFEAGDPYDPEVVAESARKLRNLDIFADADIEVSRVEGDSVDILVRTRELWSTALNVSYDRFEDDTLWTLEIREKNFLGTARGFEFARREDPDRDTWILGASDRQLIDGTWEGHVRWANATDGASIQWTLDREFVQLTGKWAVRMGYRDAQFSPRYYVAENFYVRPDVRRSAAAGEWGWRSRLRKHTVWRGLAGAQFEYQNFSNQGPLNLYSPSGELPVTIAFPDEVPEDRRWNTAYLGFERQTRRFEDARFLFAMGTREDIPIGAEFVTRVGWTSKLLGSSADGLWFNLDHIWFSRLSRHWLQLVRAEGGGLVGGGEGRDLRLIVDFAQYHQPRRALTFAWALRGGIADEIDRGSVFHLGLDTGLRAARYRELAGDRLLRANAEVRVFRTRDFFRLFAAGVVVFSDFGTAWFEESRDFRWDQVRGAYGAGLRFGLTRAAADVPVRVDFAWPMLYPTQQPQPVISIGTGHVF